MGKPIQLDLLFLSKLQARNIPSVTTTETMSEDGLYFHEEGLFSTDIFGGVGTEQRVKQLGKISLNMAALHPLQYKNLISLDTLYKGIFESKVYAIFDEKTKNFIKADVISGETGYSFFMKHVNNLVIPRDKSGKTEGYSFVYKTLKEKTPTLPKERDFKIDLFYIYRDRKLVEFKDLLVLEAGIRDYMEDEDGNAKEDEINDIYRKIINYSNMSKNFSSGFDNAGIDNLRFKMQMALTELYDYVIAMLKGKSKFIEDKWSKRATDNGTFNVLTSLPTNIFSLNNLEDAKPKATFNHTIIGLHQALRAIAPLARYYIREKFTSKIFPEGSKMGKLIDKDTLRTVTLEIHEEDRDYFTSNEGLDKLMAKIKSPDVINMPIEVDNHYLMVIYDNGKEVGPVFDTSLLTDKQLEHVRPITYGELLYLSGYKPVEEYPGIVTRFPIADAGSTYPVLVYLKVTIESREVILLDEYLEEEVTTLYEFPKNTSKHFGSMVVDMGHLPSLGADSMNS